MMPSVAILAGGLATRLRPITQTIPKSLVEVAGKPFLFHQLDLLQQSNIENVVLCVGYLGEQIQEVLPTGAPWNMNLAYSFDGEPLMGTGGAIRKALPLLSDPFFILYGDSYLPIRLDRVLAAFPNDKSGLMTVFRNEGKWDSSNIHFENGILHAYNKKVITPQMRYIDYGLSILRKDVFHPFSDGPFDLAELLMGLSGNGDIAGYEVKKRFYEIGSIKGLEELRQLFSSGQLPESIP